MEFEAKAPPFGIFSPSGQPIKHAVARSSDGLANAKERGINITITRTKAAQIVGKNIKIWACSRDELDKARVGRQTGKVFFEIDQGVIGVEGFEIFILIVLMKKKNGNNFGYMERFWSTAIRRRRREVVIEKDTEGIDKTKKMS